MHDSSLNQAVLDDTISAQPASSKTSRTVCQTPYFRDMLSAGSLLPHQTVVLHTQSRQGNLCPSTLICRPQRERRPPQKFADAAELSITSAEPSGERLLARQKPALQCDVFLSASDDFIKPGHFIAGRGAKRSAAQALYDDAVPFTGQPQRASQRSATATSLRPEMMTEINQGGSYLLDACLQ